MRAILPAAPFLYALTDRTLGGSTGSELARRLFAAGVPIVQLREKGIPDAMLLQECRAAEAAALASRGLLIVNDRVDLALLSGAHGVHLGQDDLPVAAARALAGDRLLIGCSTHSVEDALTALEGDGDAEIDYVALGPIYPSPTKPGRNSLGPEAVLRVTSRTNRPLVVIGGIGLDRVAEVVEAGASGVAVVSAVFHSGVLEERVRELLEALSRTQKEGAGGLGTCGEARETMSRQR